ncbi:ribbon-helix-helix protein, CopG family [uncultured Sphingomonas sp.]|uniref:type II toxin-antitoxin system RelB family antitoxin n=1 Tax=uncultured Sphingomonas sp. TaxID=158754 RepID=UPI0035CB8CF9
MRRFIICSPCSGTANRICGRSSIRPFQGREEASAVAPRARRPYVLHVEQEHPAMLGVRIDSELEQRLAAVARSQGRSKSDIAREAVRRYVERHDEAFMAEAKRQSLRASARDSADDYAFWEGAEGEDFAWK